jgi:hypothetical protein
LSADSVVYSDSSKRGHDGHGAGPAAEWSPWLIGDTQFSTGRKFRSAFSRR